MRVVNCVTQMRYTQKSPRLRSTHLSNPLGVRPKRSVKGKTGPYLGDHGPGESYRMRGHWPYLRHQNGLPRAPTRDALLRHRKGALQRDRHPLRCSQPPEFASRHPIPYLSQAEPTRGALARRRVTIWHWRCLRIPGSRCKPGVETR